MAVAITNLNPPADPGGFPRELPISFDIESSANIDFVIVSVQYITDPHRYVVFESDGFTVPYDAPSTVAGTGTPTVSLSLFEFGNWRDRIYKVFVDIVSDGVLTQLVLSELPEPVVDQPFMVLLDTAEALGGNVATLDFTGLDGDSDGIYHVEFYIKTTANEDVALRFNDDAGNASSRRHTVNSTDTTFAVLMIADSSATGDEHEGRIVVNAPKTLAGVAKNRWYRCDTNWVTSTMWSRLYVGRWANSVDNITKISLVSLSGSIIAEGSWARLYRYAL